jgi:hypothetical protein
MRSFAIDALRSSVLAIFEPTGNIRCQSSGSQIQQRLCWAMRIQPDDRASVAPLGDTTV